MMLKNLLLVPLALFVYAGMASAVISEINVTSPNGGEVWNGTQTITWTSKGCSAGETINIYAGVRGVTLDHPGTSFMVASNIDCSLGAYDWNTATSFGGDRADYQIKVRRTIQVEQPEEVVGMPMNLIDLTPSDWSDDFFTIDNPEPGSEILWLPIIIMGAGIILGGGIVLLAWKGKREKGKKK